MHPDLHHPDAERRFRAAVSLNGQAVDARWPRACWGSANGWLMLVGPSPGRKDPDEPFAPGGPNRPFDSVPSIGPDAGAIAYRSNKGRNKRWAMLSAAVFDQSSHADALTTVANLDWGHNPDHKSIPDQYLLDGCRFVYGVMKETKPRVVVTLVVRTWGVLMRFLETSDAATVDYRALGLLDACAIRLPGYTAATLIVRSPQHPSQPYFAQYHANDVASEVRNFLDAGI